MRIRWWQAAILLCLLLIFASPLASSAPDGLESVSRDNGFDGRAVESPLGAMPGYLFHGVQNQALATILAALSGVLAVSGLMTGAAWLLKSRKADNRVP